MEYFTADLHTLQQICTFTDLQELWLFHLNNTLRFFIKTHRHISRLLDDTNESYYWIGFLMADGHFYDKRVKLQLRIGDVDHVAKFAKFIDYTGKGKESVCVMDSNIIPKVRTKFGITSHKTYEPCSIDFESDDLFWSLMIGFIDGDGSIRHQPGRRDCSITIKCHSSWLDNLQHMSNRVAQHLNVSPNKALINTNGYARVSFTNSIILRFLKSKAIQLSLPYMPRKWDKIDLNYKSRVEIGRDNMRSVFEMLSAGKRKTDIARALGLTNGAVSNILKRHGRKINE